MKKTDLLYGTVAVMLLATSCSSNAVYPQNEGGGKAVKEIIQTSFDPEKQIEEINISTKEELYGELGTISIVYWDGDTQMDQVYSASDGLKEPEESFASKNKMPMLKKTKTRPIKEFDTEPLPNKVGEAVGLIPDEYENFSLRNYTYSVGDDGKVDEDFTINATKKGEGKTQSGRMVSQNYYEFKFKVDDSGKVAVVD